MRRYVVITVAIIILVISAVVITVISTITIIIIVRTIIYDSNYRNANDSDMAGKTLDMIVIIKARVILMITALIIPLTMI